MPNPQLNASLGSVWVNIDIWNKSEGDYIAPSKTLDAGYVREALQIALDIEVNEVTFEDGGIQVFIAFAGHSYSLTPTLLKKITAFFRKYFKVENNRPQL